MRIHINTQELNAGISTVIKALSVRTTVSILEGIYLEASNGCPAGCFPRWCAACPAR